MTNIDDLNVLRKLHSDTVDMLSRSYDFILSKGLQREFKSFMGMK